MKVAETLAQLGFSEKESQVYLANLELGQDTVFNIARKAGMSRSTVNFTLDKLVERGLASLRQTKKATLYRVLSPSRLMARVAKQQESLRKTLPELEELYRHQPHRPVIETYSGIEGVKQVYQDIMNTNAKGKEVLYYGDISHYSTPEYQDVISGYVAGMRDKSKHARELITENSGNLSWYKKLVKATANPNYITRSLPKDFPVFNTETMIYGDKTAIFSHGKDIFATVIESPNIAESYRSLFNFAWNWAK